MQEDLKNFKNLKIWQAGMDLAENIYAITNNFPTEERYTLISQMRRAAISLPSNIAEGFKRYHNKEFKQFLHISLASSAELETQLILSERVGYLTKDELEKLTEKITAFSKMTTALTKKLN